LSGRLAGTSNNGWTNGLLPMWWDWSRIGVNTVNTWGYTGSGQTIAVIDSGVDRYHTWLSGKVVNEACFASTFSTQWGVSGACPDGTNVQYGLGAAAPCGNPGCDHGTHVAHTAAGVNGVASGANLMAIQIFHCCLADGRPTYYESDLVWALKHVYDNRFHYRIAAVNMSIGGARAYGYCDGSLGDNSVNVTYIAGWINALKNAGIATVVSSGNDDDPQRISRPGCVANAISVGNTTLDAAGNDAVFGYAARAGSNSNATLDLLAPGTDICSAVPNNRYECDGWIGTSMAAPHVAGAFAVARSFSPAASVDQILVALQRSGTAVYDDRNGVTRTRIHVANALYEL